jgi:hypothetical protein
MRLRRLDLGGHGLEEFRASSASRRLRLKNLCKLIFCFPLDSCAEGACRWTRSSSLSPQCLHRVHADRPLCRNDAPNQSNHQKQRRNARKGQRIIRPDRE